MRFIFILLFGLWLPVAAHGGPTMCKYGKPDDKGVTIDIAQIYKAADVVVIGRVLKKAMFDSNLIFKVDKTLKGSVGDDVILHGAETTDTVLDGFLLPGNRDLMLFLKSGTSGVYENVEEYNSPCNILFFIKDGKVVFIEPDHYNQGLEVAVDKVKDYLESSPPALAYKYK